MPIIRFANYPFRKTKKKEWRGAKTCNLGVWRDDFNNINGLDESYIGWGREDSDFVVRLINSGIIFIPANFSTQVIEENTVNIFKLNTVERKVLKKLCTGQSNKEIAQSLNLIENNIKMYMRCLCKKMGAKNRTHIVIIAFQNKIILA